MVIVPHTKVNVIFIQVQIADIKVVLIVVYQILMVNIVELVMNANLEVVM